MRLKILLAALFELFTLPSRADVLAPQDYLSQVLQSHGGLSAALLERDGSLSRAKDADLSVYPSFFANATLSHDDRQNPLFLTNEQTLNNYSLGIQEVTTFGTQLKLSYNVGYNHYVFSPATMKPTLSYNQAGPELDLTQSLWRNGFGSETRAQLEASEASALSTSHAQGYQARLILSQAEVAYWNLSLARENVRVATAVLKRAQDLFDWSARRERLGLGDDSDRLQADALLKLRQLDYQQSMDNERIASQEFNQLRNRSEARVADQVQPLEGDLPLDAPSRAQMREDVIAAQEQSRASDASARLGAEKSRPDVSVFASAAYGSNDPDFHSAFQDSMSTSQPAFTAGVKLSVPLDFDLLSDTKRGYAKEREAAYRLYERKAFEQENDWSDLNQRLTEAKKRFELNRSVETIQNEKLSVERERLKRGKSSTFNVIQFEQDAAQAKLAVLRSKADILVLIAQMKTFGGPL